MKLLYAPLRMITNRLAGAASRRIVGRLWGVIDGGARPRPDQSAAPWPRLLAALAIEGVVFRTVSGAAEHASRRWFARMTGRWPGEPPGEKRED
jgi:hypothetical protein